jgi:hypothetical protein
MRPRVRYVCNGHRSTGNTPTAPGYLRLLGSSSCPQPHLPWPSPLRARRLSGVQNQGRHKRPVTDACSRIRNFTVVAQCLGPSRHGQSRRMCHRVCQRRRRTRRTARAAFRRVSSLDQMAGQTTRTSAATATRPSSPTKTRPVVPATAGATNASGIEAHLGANLTPGSPRGSLITGVASLGYLHWSSGGFLLGQGAVVHVMVQYFSDSLVAVRRAVQSSCVQVCGQLVQTRR